MAPDTDGGTGGISIAAAPFDIKRVADRDRLQSGTGLQLPAGQVVDRHVTPPRVVRDPIIGAGETRSLPGQVVVVEDGRPSSEGEGDGVGGWPVERKRAEVLDNDQIGEAQTGVERLEIRRAGVVDAKAGDDRVGRWGAGDRPGPPSETLQGIGPFRRLDGHAVRAAEAEGHQRRGGMLGFQRVR